MPSFFLLVVAASVQHTTWNDRSLLFGTPVERDGLHAQLAVGVAGGLNNEGLFHTLELGFTFRNGLTLCALQTGVQNRGVLGPDRGPDYLGGWLLELKVPVLVPELELKAAAGLGALLDEWKGLHVVTGFGWAYGLDGCTSSPALGGRTGSTCTCPSSPPPEQR
jgi:hypothetical protein